jgi:hypothetical protein
MPSPLQAELLRLIAKPLGTLRDEATVRLVLKRRLTKKEFKVFEAIALNTPPPETMRQRLRLNTERYRSIRESIVRKVNRDTLKRELFEP